MEYISWLWDHVLPPLIGFSILVFIHELGHYLAARWAGVRVEIFSIGFGRELFGWTDKAGTRWRFSLIPLGGYVSMFGEVQGGDSDDSPSSSGLSDAEKAVSFRHQSVGWRSLILAAGPAANFLFAIVVLAVTYSLVGKPVTAPVVSGLVAGGAAEQAGLEVGDRIVSINGRAIETFSDIRFLITHRAGDDLKFIVRRDDQEIPFTLIPELRETTDVTGQKVRQGLIGITGRDHEIVIYGPLAAFWAACAETWRISAMTLEAVGQMFIGERGTEDLGGPIRIVELLDDFWQSGFLSAVAFLAFLSINLGLINLFPIPILDGGHLLFCAIEALRGRPLGERAQEISFRFGVAVIAFLFLFASYNDLARLADRWGVLG